MMELLKSVGHPDEVVALLKYKFGGCSTVTPKNDSGEMGEDLKTCYHFLNQTSRSFAAVIQALDGELRHAICLFYLVLRALDTVEDDMSIPTEKKIKMLREFYTYLDDPDWKFMQSQEKDKMVLEQFPVISSEYRKLAAVYQTVICDITHKMGEGMTVYLEKAPDTMADWDEYCHYVAGLVGIGLSRIFSASQLEDRLIGEDTRLANSMGLFLQKTNIIRDYLEDVRQAREFWPKQAWGKYGKLQIDLLREGRREKALFCLNELVTNALQHVPDVILYLSRINNQSVFNFCAIPQVMAIATLERCYNNGAVFNGVVKIRKGEAVRLMMEATSMDAVKAIFNHFTTQIQRRIPPQDPSCKQTHSAVWEALSLCDTTTRYIPVTASAPFYVTAGLLASAIVWQYLSGLSSIYDYITSVGGQLS